MITVKIIQIMINKKIYHLVRNIGKKEQTTDQPIIHVIANELSVY